jgi:SAM-dependent methyltransferase
MFNKVARSLITHPLARELNSNEPETLNRRFRIIRGKSFLNKFYQDCYLSIAKSLPADCMGPVLELGSGGGFLKDYVSNLFTSEIVPIPLVDIILDGQKLPFKRDILRGIVMLDVFHHLPDIRRFFSEANACIKPNGVIVMIEPWTTRWSRWVYKYLHHEPFDPATATWHFFAGDPSHRANSALPWIVFERDKQEFEQQFSYWQIKEIKLRTPFCYLLSGGISFRSLMPGFMYKPCRQIENLFHSRMRYWAMFAKIVLVKKIKDSFSG